MGYICGGADFQVSRVSNPQALPMNPKMVEESKEVEIN
jgi:hypothetical protein